MSNSGPKPHSRVGNCYVGTKVTGLWLQASFNDYRPGSAHTTWTPVVTYWAATDNPRLAAGGGMTVCGNVGTVKRYGSIHLLTHDSVGSCYNTSTDVVSAMQGRRQPGFYPGILPKARFESSSSACPTCVPCMCSRNAPGCFGHRTAPSCPPDGRCGYYTQLRVHRQTTYFWSKKRDCQG